MNPRLTVLAQQTVAATLGDGDLVVDATVGNGHDTVFLASRVAPSGQVAGFDIQEAALAAARRRLVAAGLENQVQLIQLGHQRLLSQLPAAWAGQVAAVMFNLGYLPGADKALVTRPDTTLAALEQSLILLRRGGILSIMAYRDHAGAASEYAAVVEWARRLPAGYEITIHESPGPVLFLVEKVAD